MLVPCLNDTANHQTTYSSIDAGKGKADTPADSLTPSLAESERRALNNNNTADWYKAGLMNARPSA